MVPGVPSLWQDVRRVSAELLRDPHSVIQVTRFAVGLIRAPFALRGADLGARITVMGPVKLSNHGRALIDHHAYFLPGMLPTRIEVRPGGELRIGPHSGFNFGILIDASERIAIGARCMLASMVTLKDAPGHPISIGDDVWIAHGATVSPGVTIGAGSVVSAGTTVTRDVPPHHLAIGAPARNVKLDTLNRGR